MNQVTVDLYGHLVPGANRSAADRLADRIAVASSELARNQPSLDTSARRKHRRAS
jgi:hypothetical protein